MHLIQPKPESNLSGWLQICRKRSSLVLAWLVLAAAVGAPDAITLRQLPGVLNPLRCNYPSSVQAALAAFGTAVKEFAAGRFSSSLAAMPPDAAASSLAIAGHVTLFRAKALLELGKAQEALDVLGALAGRNSNSPVGAQTVLCRSRAFLMLHNPRAALAELDSTTGKDDAEVLCLRAQALHEAGNNSEAIRVYLRVIADFISSDFSNLAEQRLRALSPNFLTGAENRDTLLRRCENLIGAGRSQDARLLLLRLQRAPVPGPFAERQWLLLADAGTNLSRFTESLQYLGRVSGPALAAQVNYLKGVCYRGLGRETAFLETRDRALQLYPQSAWTEKLLYSVAAYHDVAGRMAEARAAYGALVSSFPKGEYAERSYWRTAMLCYADGAYEEALNGYRRSFLVNPVLSAAPASAYWIGRCYMNLGRAAEAASIFRRVQSLANGSYYGQLAQKTLAGLPSAEAHGSANTAADDFSQLDPQLDTVRPAAPVILEPSPAALLTIERTRQLMAAGLPDLALTEISHGMDPSGSGDAALRYAKALILQSQDKWLDVIVTLRRIAPDYIHLPPSALPQEIWDLLFPVRYRDEIARNAALFGLDPDLILAMIRQESAFQESARSTANARGLMQLLPSTGRMLARQAGMRQFTVARLYQAGTNIALGTRYFAERLRKYGGSVELALAAYNAGDARVDRWLKEFGNADMAEFVERIPFSETRGYVKQVLTNRVHYQLLAANPRIQQPLK